MKKIFINLVSDDEEEQEEEDNRRPHKRQKNSLLKEAFLLLRSGSYRSFLGSKIIREEYFTLAELLDEKVTIEITRSWHLYWQRRLLIHKRNNNYKAQCALCGKKENLLYDMFRELNSENLIYLNALSINCYVDKFKHLTDIIDLCYELSNYIESEDFEEYAENRLRNKIRKRNIADVD